MATPAHPPPPRAPSPHRIARRERLIILDYALLSLAFLSLFIFLVAHIIALGEAERTVLRWVDYAAIMLFGLGFLARLISAESTLRYLARSWFEALAFLPITVDVFGLGRWFFILQIAIVLARFSEALDRTFGERVFHRMFARYKAMLVEELTDPILLRLATSIQGVLHRGRLMESLGRNLDKRRPEIHAAVLKAVEANPKVRRLYAIPMVQDRVREAVEGAVDSAVASLTSEEMHRLVSESLYEVFEDLKADIVRKHWKDEGVGVGDVTHGLFRRSDGP